MTSQERRTIVSGARRNGKSATAGAWAEARWMCCTHLRRGRCWQCALLRTGAHMKRLTRVLMDLAQAATGTAAAFKPLAMAPGEAEFLAARRFQERTIAQTFGVPAHMMGGQFVQVICCTHMEVELLRQAAAVVGSVVVERRCAGCREERRAYTCTPWYQRRAALRRWMDRVAQVIRGEA